MKSHRVPGAASGRAAGRQSGRMIELQILIAAVFIAAAIFIPKVMAGEGVFLSLLVSVGWVAAIIGGHVSAGVSGVGEFMEQIKGGKMRALAVSSPAKFEGIASLKEQGIDVELGNWRGIFGAPGITPQQRDALVKLVKDATETPAWKATLEKLGWTPVFLGGDDYRKFIDEDNKRVAAIIESLGLKK